MNGGLFTEELTSRWRTDGWCVVPRAFSGDLLARAQEAVLSLFPTAEEMDSGVDDERTAPWRTSDAPWPEFPFASDALNRLVVHEALIEAAQELLETPDVRLYQGTLTAKYADQSSGYNQLLHTDYPNHSILVPRRDAGYQQLETVHLPERRLDGQRGHPDGVPRLTADIPVERHTLRFDDYAALYDDPGEAAGPAGSIVAYRPDVYHRSVDRTEPGLSRFMLHVAYKPAGAEWGGLPGMAGQGLTPAWHNFVQGASPRQLTAVGFPEPGHRYWTEETLAGVQARYPGLDMSPWKAAFESGP